MTLAYGAGAFGLAILAGQSAAGGTGLDQLNAALNGDAMATGQILDQAAQVVGTGMNLGQAAVIIALVPLAMRLLQSAQPFLETLNLWWRKKLLGPDHVKAAD